MGREVRRVPANWEHPRNAKGKHIPLFDADFASAASEWKAGFVAHDPSQHDGAEYWEWFGPPPDREKYRPAFLEEERTHFQMYETCSEGKPISPVMPDIESLARWLADTGASAFAGQPATYEQWLGCCRRGGSVSAVFVPEQGLVSGVEYESIHE